MVMELGVTVLIQLIVVLMVMVEIVYINFVIRLYHWVGIWLSSSRYLYRVMASSSYSGSGSLTPA